MVDLFYASSNPTKVRNLKNWLREEDYNILTPADLGLDIRIEEEGATVIENAVLKVKAFYDMAGLPTLAHDTGLYLYGVPESLQPGLKVRRIGDKEMNDLEVLDYYTSLSRQYGGRLRARYYRGVALMTEEGLFTKEVPGADMWILDTPVRYVIEKGNPLDCVSIDVISGKCWLDLSVSERDAAYGFLGSEIAAFLKEHL